jgi:hypothetical protein
VGADRSLAIDAGQRPGCGELAELSPHRYDATFNNWRNMCRVCKADTRWNGHFREDGDQRAKC